MLRKIFFAISLVLSIAMCLALLTFPIMKYDPDVVEQRNQTFINQYIEEHRGEASEEVLRAEAIDIIIDSISANLQIHGNVGELIQNENGEWINSGIDEELRNLELERLRNHGIKYRDLANGIKNQCTYDKNLYNILKNNNEITRMERKQLFFQAWINPIPFIVIVLLIALEFASAFLVIIRSVKGIMGKRKTKLLAISIFGCAMSLFLLVLPTLFSKEMVEDILPNNYIGLFITNIRGTGLCYYYFIGFAICTVLAIFTKFLKREN